LTTRRAFLAETLLLAGRAPGSANGGTDALHRQYVDPPHEYSIAPYWFWNGAVSAPETRRQMEAMIAQGVREATILPWDGMSPGYLSEEFWTQLGAALDSAEALGFTLNLLDDYDWPTGHLWQAGANHPELSLVLQKKPEYRMRKLAYREQTLASGQEWSAGPILNYEAVIAGQLDAENRVDASTLRLIDSKSWRAPAGRWLVSTYWTEPSVGGHNTRVDLLNPDAVRLFIDLFYEELKKRHGRHLGRTLKLTIADHEGDYGEAIAWTPAMWREFRTRRGYDARVRLPLLMHQSTDGVSAQQFRIDYLDMISRLYASSFSGQVNDWCVRNGLKHGVSLYEEQLYIQVNGAGDMFQHWRNSSMIMTDALLERGRSAADFREAASVADLEGRELWVENQGLQGHSTFFSLEKARYGSNAILLWGANKLCPYFLYDPQKVSWPPHWFLGQPAWPWFGNYAAHMRRALFMNGSGRRVSRVAVYYPLETAFANSEILFTNQPHRDLVWDNLMDHTQNIYTALQLELEARRIETHVLDRQYVAQAEVSGKHLRLKGQEFDVLLLPPMTHIDEPAAARIREFAAAGGQVLATGALPASLRNAAGVRSFNVPVRPRFMDRLDYMNPTVVPPEIRADLAPVMDVVSAAIPTQPRIVEGESPAVRWSHRRSPDGLEWYWIINDSTEARSIRLRMPRASVYELWNPATGERTMLSATGSEVTIEFEPWQGFHLVAAGESTAKQQPELVMRETRPVPNEGWMFVTGQVVLAPYPRTSSGEPLWLAPERLSARNWWLIGPFPYDDHQGFYREYQPESGFDPEAKYEGAFGDVAWQWIESPTYTVTPREVLKLPRSHDRGIFYAFCHVHSPRAMDAQLVATFADGMKAWVNGELVLDMHRHPKWLLMRDIWADRRPVKLREGWNHVLLKIEPSLMVPTVFMFRFSSADGRTLRELTWSREAALPAGQSAKALRLQVAIPPGAQSFLMPRFEGPVQVRIDGRFQRAAPAGQPVRLPAGARQLEFDTNQGGEPEAPVRFKTGPVRSELFRWTGTPLSHYSGTAVYERDIEVPRFAAGEKVVLDLGMVGLAAEVWVNGKSAGQRAWRPFRFDLTKNVKPGRNRLRIVVANSDAGWQCQGDTIYPRGSWGLKYATELDRLPTLVPNGLEGPVTLTILRPEAL